MAIAERTASNFFAFRAGMMLSYAVSTHTHLAFACSQMAFPRSISKPTSDPSAALDSKDGKEGSTPNLITVSAWLATLKEPIKAIITTLYFFTSYSLERDKNFKLDLNYIRIKQNRCRKSPPCFEFWQKAHSESYCDG